MASCVGNIYCVLQKDEKYFSSKKRPNFKYAMSNYYSNASCWMRHLPDDMYLSEANIPGSHETMSQYTSFGITVTVCQSWKLVDQLNIGLRCFDIRVKQDTECKFPLYHYTSFQKAYFIPDVLDVMENFLKVNPTEALMMMIRIEQFDKDSKDFALSFDEIVKKRPHLFVIDDKIPLLRNMRGKIWVWIGTNWVYDGFKIKDSMNSGLLLRQDDYDIPLKKKKEEVRDCNTLSKESRHLREKGEYITINQINGVLWNEWPASYATVMNKYVFKEEFTEGIIMFDFPSELLIQRIINTNFDGESGPATRASPLDIDSKANQFIDKYGETLTKEVLAKEILAQEIHLQKKEKHTSEEPPNKKNHELESNIVTIKSTRQQ